MEGLSSIKEKIASMSMAALDMWQDTFRTFMEHDADLIPGILEKENKLNDLEKEITSELVSLGRASSKKSDKAVIDIYVNVVGDLELIGDYCKDILERIEIKIEEKLLFSEEAVKEYTELYRKTEEALDEITMALKKDKASLVREVLAKEEHIDRLVDVYRKKHNQRMVDGICSPMACNMFLNMLDFTAAVYYHAKKIAKNLLKLKS
jgi:phosphate:Na+ symporter